MFLRLKNAQNSLRHMAVTRRKIDVSSPPRRLVADQPKKEWDQKYSIPARVGVISAMIGACFAFYYYNKMVEEELLDMEQEQNSWNSSMSYPIGRDDWTLIDCRTNKVITKQDLNGKWVLMYFGFAHCPDICPETMEKVMDIMDIHKHAQKSNPDLREILPVFITIDPERDNPEALADYLEEFPQFLGLTGSGSQIKEVCRNYKIYFSVGPKSDDGDYILDHSIVIYLINPNGVYQNHFMERSKPPEEIYPVIMEQFKLFDRFNTVPVVTIPKAEPPAEVEKS